MEHESAAGNGSGSNCFCIPRLTWLIVAAAACCLAACSNKSGSDNTNSPIIGAGAGGGGAFGGAGGTPGLTGGMGGIGGTGTNTPPPPPPPVSAGGSGGAMGSAMPPPGGTGGSGGTMAGSGGEAGSDQSSTDMTSDAGTMMTTDASTGTDTSGCTREKLKAAVDAFYDAIAAHSTDNLNLAADVKYTENAMTLMPGEGVWKTAGMAKIKRSAIDTTLCMTATESVIPDGSTDRVYGVRLKLNDNDEISEIETILVTNYILINPMGLVNSKDDDWETVLPPDEQMPRDQLQAIMDKYLEQFPSGACGFASSCTRLEDGGSVGACVDGALVTCNMNGGGGSPVLKVRQHVIDVEAGITVGFTVFLGGYDDFHLFKVRDGEVQSVHAVLTQTNNETGW